MQIILDLNPVEAEIISDALKEKMKNDSSSSLWTSGVLNHYNNKKEEALKKEYPHLCIDK